MLYYRDLDGSSISINYRIYDHLEGKTKNYYFREMFEEVVSWRLKPYWRFKTPILLGSLAIKSTRCFLIILSEMIFLVRIGFGCFYRWVIRDRAATLIIRAVGNISTILKKSDLRKRRLKPDKIFYRMK